MNIKLVITALALAANTAFAGSITNGDFSTGDLTGWTAKGPVSVFDSGTNFVASLMAGRGKNVYTTLSQTLRLNAGDVLSGSAQFLANDFFPFNDDAYVSIGSIKLFTASVASVGDFGTSLLTNFSFTAPRSGNYVLRAGVENRGDNGNDSELRVSNFTVPEPASVALLALGMLGFAIARRKSAT